MNLFQVIHRRESRAGGQLMLESFDMLRRTFDQHFHATVIKVLHITSNLVTRGGALRKEAVTHSLHFATHKKLPSNWRHIRQSEFNPSTLGVQSKLSLRNSKNRDRRRNFFPARPVIWRKIAALFTDGPGEVLEFRRTQFSEVIKND